MVKFVQRRAFSALDPLLVLPINYFSPSRHGLVCAIKSVYHYGSSTLSTAFTNHRWGWGSAHKGIGRIHLDVSFYKTPSSRVLVYCNCKRCRNGQAWQYSFSLASAIGENLDGSLEDMGNYNFSVGFADLISMWNNKDHFPSSDFFAY